MGPRDITGLSFENRVRDAHEAEVRALVCFGAAAAAHVCTTVIVRFADVVSDVDSLYTACDYDVCFSRVLCVS